MRKKRFLKKTSRSLGNKKYKQFSLSLISSLYSLSLSLSLYFLSLFSSSFFPPFLLFSHSSSFHSLPFFLFSCSLILPLFLFSLPLSLSLFFLPLSSSFSSSLSLTSSASLFSLSSHLLCIIKCITSAFNWCLSSWFWFVLIVYKHRMINKVNSDFKMIIYSLCLTGLFA